MWLVVTAIEHPQQTSRRGRHNTIWFRVYDPIFVVGLYETLSKELQLLEFNFSLWQMLTAMYVYMKYSENLRRISSFVVGRAGSEYGLPVAVI